MKLPIFKFSEIYHVGNLQQKQQRQDSYEGDTLSVSLTPHEWCRVARIGGNGYVISEEQGIKLIDVLTLKENTDFMKKFYSEMIEKGLLEKVQSYVHTYFDDEMDEYLSQEFETREEAEEELDYLLEEEPFEDLITINNSYKMTSDGLDAVNATDYSKFSTDLLLIKYLEDITSDLDIQGVYFEEEFEPSKYSLPRGGVFQSKLDNLRIVETENLPSFDEEEVSNIQNISKDEIELRTLSLKNSL